MQEAGGAGFLSHVSYVSDDDGCPLFPLTDSQAASNLRDADAATFLAHDTASVALLGNESTGTQQRSARGAMVHALADGRLDVGLDLLG